MEKLFDKLPRWARFVLLSLELAIVIYAIFIGTTTTVLYQGF